VRFDLLRFYPSSMPGGMGGIMHAAGSVANKKRRERAILSDLFFLETVLMTTTLTVRGEPGIL
jgi:hypothetical protein